MKINDMDMARGIAAELEEDLRFAIRAARLMSQQAADAGIEALQSLKAGEEREDVKDRRILDLENDLAWQRRETDRREAVIRSLNLEIDKLRLVKPEGCFKAHMDDLPSDGIVAGMHLTPFKINGGKIPTIKAVRQLTGMGLKESKDLVDGWEANGSIDFLAPHFFHKGKWSEGNCNVCGKPEEHRYHKNDTAGDLPY